MSQQRLHIDWTACDGRGLCVEILPELLTQDDWGFPLAVTPDPPVPADLTPHAHRAVTACPRLALKLLPG
jgi:ferredoxin